jgi:DNA helicase-2/ATP-dependent DNA helicase PcrA
LYWLYRYNKDMNFEQEYRALNDEQRTAVNQTEGALLVIAGPGTGKTQLLSIRAAHLLKKGVVSASSILCLSFTDAAATEMRERLQRMMGTDGGDVVVHTFHSFGSWLIAQHPELFGDEIAQQPLDELGRYTILEGLLQKLPLRHPLAVHDENHKFIRQHAVQQAIQAFKQAALTPSDIRAKLATNQIDYTALEPLLAELFGTTLSAKRLPSITDLVTAYQAKANPKSYQGLLLKSLLAAVAESVAAGKTKALGDWRTKYTTMSDGKRITKSAQADQLLQDTINLYERYQAVLKSSGRFDYDDMIMWAVEALENNDDLRFDVAERFQYIMVDEYQDTNGAQNRLLDAILQAHPTDSPNVLVVGDDDQAIMRFQGAELSGMMQYISRYQPTITVLTDNYRSSQAILDAARQIITQTDERLEVTVTDQPFTKLLIAKEARPDAALSRLAYASPTAQYGGVAEQIKALLEQGVASSEIGVIARKHAELEAFVPFLRALDIDVDYDRREHILDHPMILRLLDLAQLITDLAAGRQHAKSRLAQVLAADYWALPRAALYDLAAAAKTAKQSWLDIMLTSDNPDLQHIAEWLLAAASASQVQNFTQMFDVLIGRQPLANTQLKNSPFLAVGQLLPPEKYIQLISHLICLRQKVLANRPDARGLADFLEVITLYRQSGIYIIDNNPLLRGKGVQLMSAHGSKGREFGYVFLLSVVDDRWGNRARANNNRIRLPENLPLYDAGDTESDRLRLLYVAMTRAKSQLYICEYTQTDDGKPATPLSYLALGEDSGWGQPEPRTIDENVAQRAIETAWNPITISATDLQTSLQPALQHFRLSATALRDFLDVCYSTPIASIEKHVLGFPSAYNDRSALGSAVHKTLQQAYDDFTADKPYSKDAIITQFNDYLDASGLSNEELARVRSHGIAFLPGFIKTFRASDFPSIIASELFLVSNTPTLGVPISGAIDVISGNPLSIIDYKTGAPPSHGWDTKGLSEGKKISLHFYRQQLLFYKLLVDSSEKYGNQPVSAVELVFTEPAETSPDVVRLTIDHFDREELAKTERLIQTIHERICTANLPDISQYPKTLKGIEAFESDLLQ